MIKSLTLEIIRQKYVRMLGDRAKVFEKYIENAQVDYYVEMTWYGTYVTQYLTLSFCLDLKMLK